jgi:hypothetical protein
MTARRIQDAERRLHELREEEWSDLGLAVVAMALSLAATALYPPLALPLFIGALAVAYLAIRAIFRRWDLFDRLLLDREAYVIREVRRRAENAASMKSRRDLAESLRNHLRPVPGYPIPAQVADAAAELAELAAALEDEELLLDPVCAVQCLQLVTNGAESPLLNPALAQGLRARVRQIRAGFQPRRLAA